MIQLAQPREVHPTSALHAPKSNTLSEPDPLEVGLAERIHGFTGTSFRGSLCPPLELNMKFGAHALNLTISCKRFKRFSHS